MAIPKKDFSRKRLDGLGYRPDGSRDGGLSSEENLQDYTSSEFRSTFDTPLRAERFRTAVEARAQSAAFNLNIKQASKIVPKEIEWLFPGYLAKGELTLLAGPPSSGKTFLACYFAAAITKEDDLGYNNELPRTGTGNVIYISTEDSGDGSLVHRLIACGADLDCIQILDPNEESSEIKAFSFSEPSHINSLKEINKALDGSLNLIVIDPIYLAVENDYKSSSKSRAALENLANLAKELNCAILGIAHTVKSPKGKGALERITSPTSLQEVPRSILVTAEIENRPTESGGNFVLVRAKNSNSEPGGGFEYSICTANDIDDSSSLSARFSIKKPLTGYADDILRAAEKGKNTKLIRKQDLAKDLLIKHLSDGKVVAGAELIQIAEAMGISENTLKIAKRELGVDSRKRLGDGRSEWFLSTPMD